jgi:hypothetical protein
MFWFAVCANISRSPTMPAQDTVLPPGAICAADPQDVLAAAALQFDQAAISVSKARTKEKASGIAQLKKRKDDTQNRGDIDSGKATAACPTGRLERDIAYIGRAKKSNKWAPSNEERSKKAGNTVIEEGKMVGVPMDFVDTRPALDILIDDMIESRPSLKSLSKFEQGSVLDYIDMIGLTREEVFKGFPDAIQELPVLPVAPESRSFHRMMAEFADQHDRPEVRNRLEEALRLECKRADLLEYQVSMFRSELVTALKRWKVLTTVTSRDSLTVTSTGILDHDLLETVDYKNGLSNGKHVQ